MRTITIAVALAATLGCRPLLAVPEPDTGTDIDTETDTGTDTTTDPDTEAPPPFVLDVDHSGPEPWGMQVHILKVEGGTGPNGNLQIGDTPSVLFQVVDDEGVPYWPADLSGLDFQLTGPTSHMSIVYDYGDYRGQGVTDTEPVLLPAPEGDTAVIVDEHDYSRVAWRFTFPAPIPAVYHAPPNDTSDLGLDVGDWGGQPVVSGTYVLAAWAYRRPASGTYGGSDTAYVLLGDATQVEERERVLDENCGACHGPQLVAHGGTRTGGITLCLTCHVDGAEDRYSQQDGTTTPGTTIFMPVLIHRLHNGSKLTTSAVVNGYPGDPSLPGYPNYNAHDFSSVVFPAWPNGAAACNLCHEGASGGNVQQHSTRNACGACHDAINWATGANHGLPTDQIAPQTDDASCANSGCHQPSEVVLDHLDLRQKERFNPGLNLSIVEVGGGSGPGSQFEPGDYVRVKFKALHDDGSSVNVRTDLHSVKLRMAGPLEHMQQVLAVDDVSANVTEDILAKTWTYTATKPLPDVIPPQLNDSLDLGFEQGDWQGIDLPSGTYRIALEGDIDVVNNEVTPSVTGRLPAAATLDVLVGDATVVEKRELVVNELCEACHQHMWFHGEHRTNVANCATCHTAGAEDKYSSVDATTTPGVTIDFNVLIHKLHNGTNLTAPYVINGYGTPYTAHTFNGVRYPYMDGESAHCESCHVAGYTESSTRVCGSCHDSDTARSHISLNTDPVYGESCDVCHAIGRSAGVDAVHGL